MNESLDKEKNISGKRTMTSDSNVISVTLNNKNVSHAAIHIEPSLDMNGNPDEMRKSGAINNDQTPTTAANIDNEGVIEEEKKRRRDSA